MKKQLHKKFLAIGVIAILFSASANAQIVYTDVNPDVTRTRSGSASPSEDVNYSIDFNIDGMVDVNLSSRRIPNRAITGFPPYYFAIEAIAIAPNEILRVTSTVSYASQLNANTIIESASEFWAGNTLRTNLAINFTNCPYCWPFKADRFLGVRFSVGGNWFYGWVRISLPSIGEYTIKDYAYNSTPNQPILAGQTTTLGIDENPLVSKINIFPNPASNQVTISLGSLQQEVEVAITDTTGKTVYKIKESERQNIEVNTKDFANGIYLVQIKAKDFITTKKLVVNK